MFTPCSDFLLPLFHLLSIFLPAAEGQNAGRKTPPRPDFKRDKDPEKVFCRVHPKTNAKENHIALALPQVLGVPVCARKQTEEASTEDTSDPFLLHGRCSSS